MVGEKQSKARLAKRGDSENKFSDLHVKAFAAVLQYTAEIHDAVESKSIVALSSARLTKVDYLICCGQAVKTLSKSLQTYWSRLLRGEEIGAGSRNMLVAKLGPLFCSREYALWPTGRFFCPAEAWKEKVSKKRQNLAAMKQDRNTWSGSGQVLPNADDGVRHFGPEGSPLIIAEVTETAVAELPDDVGLDEAFDRQNQAVAVCS